MPHVNARFPHKKSMASRSFDDAVEIRKEFANFLPEVKFFHALASLRVPRRLRSPHNPFHLQEIWSCPPLEAVLTLTAHDRCDYILKRDADKSDDLVLQIDPKTASVERNPLRRIFSARQSDVPIVETKHVQAAGHPYQVVMAMCEHMLKCGYDINAESGKRLQGWDKAVADYRAARPQPPREGQAVNVSRQQPVRSLQKLREL